VIWTAFSLAVSMGLCANNGAADNISAKPKSVSVRFIRFVSYTEVNAFFEFLRDEVALLVDHPHLPERHECARIFKLT